MIQRPFFQYRRIYVQRYLPVVLINKPDNPFGTGILTKIVNDPALSCKKRKT
jgi:hypothetical protein